MTDTLAQDLKRRAEALGLMLSAGQATQLQSYLGLIQKWNKVYNLTAIRDTHEMVTHHLLDSLAVIAPLRNRLAGLAYEDDGAQDGAETGATMRVMGGGKTAPFLYNLLDVGSGAGLPGVVIAICCPDIHVTCIDAVAKKMAFVQQVATELKLSNLSARHVRVETLTEPFDVITSRAFATLSDFVAGSRAALKPETGVWMAMKAKDTSGERAELPPDIDVFHVEPLHVPGLDAERHLVWMRQKARQSA
ncbi:MAG TPA: 16S rRNA (guanine(527)-N(7))-methyltransferase RsmG [Burkholderiaceae bacterium]|nr:16S rRNA (guanine(527)-N(7))-methyltransferase RsmG [Burkholderiaceae bacterium]